MTPAKVKSAVEKRVSSSGGGNILFNTIFNNITFDNTTSSTVATYALPLNNVIFVMERADFTTNSKTCYLRCFTVGIKNGIYQKLNTFSVNWPCANPTSNFSLDFHSSSSSNLNAVVIDDIVLVMVYVNSYYHRLYFKASENGATVYTSSLTTTNSTYHSLINHTKYYGIKFTSPTLQLLAKTGYSNVTATLTNMPTNPVQAYPLRSFSSAFHFILYGTSPAVVSLYSVTQSSSGLTPSYTMSLSSTPTKCNVFSDETSDYLCISYAAKAEIYRIFDTSFSLIRSIDAAMNQITPTKKRTLFYTNDSRTFVLDNTKNFSTLYTFSSRLSPVEFYSGRGSYDINTMEPFAYIAKETNDKTTSTMDQNLSYLWTFDGSLAGITISGNRGELFTKMYSLPIKTAMIPG